MSSRWNYPARLGSAIVTTTEGLTMNAKLILNYIIPLVFALTVYALSLSLVAFSFSMDSTFLVVTSLIFTVAPLYAVVFFLAELINKIK
tara:strand:- start:2998 stop:3264 length:267 start_codon:yes stop_codon:yes gene_type:complete